MVTENYIQDGRTGPGICAGLSFGICQAGGSIRSDRAANVGERACCRLRDETARNKRRDKDKGYVRRGQAFQACKSFRG